MNKAVICCLITAILIMPLASCGKDYTYIEKISFPQTASDLPGDVDVRFILSKENAEKLGKALPLYRIVSRRNNKTTAAYYDGCLFKVFTQSVQATVKKEYYTEYSCNNGDTLEIYESGSFIYRKGVDYSEPLRLSDDEIIESAEKFLKMHALLPEGFKAGKSLGGIFKNGAEPLMKSVGFYREIDGYEVYGRSDIVVEVAASGICSVSSIYSDYEFEKTVECLSLQEIEKICPSDYGQIVYSQNNLSGKAERIVINDVKVMYYDSPVNQPELRYIQPVYQLKGTVTDTCGKSADCFWIIPAASGALNK